jgi:hypothetical protein
MGRHTHLILVTGLTLAAFGLRAFHVTRQPFLGWDDAIFAVQGRHLAETGRFDYTWGRPLHVTLIGLAYSLLGVRAEAGSLVSVFLGSLTAPMAYVLGARAFGKGAGLAAAGLLAASYFHLFWSRWMQSQAGVIACLALGALAYAGSLRAGGARPWRCLAAGAALGAAYTLHYSVFMLLPVWAAFEAFAGFKLGWRPRVRLARAAGLAAGFLAVTGLFAFVLMPPEHPLWYAMARWYNWRALARGCCYLNEVLTPFYEDGLGHGRLGDWTYYFRAVLAFEGSVGLIALLSAWPFGLWSARRGLSSWLTDDRSARQAWIVWQAIGGFAVLVAAAASGSDARAKIVALVLAPNVILLGGLVASVGRAAARRWGGPAKPPGWLQAGAAATLAAVILWRAWPLLSLSTPYAAAAAYLESRPEHQVIGLYSGSQVKPFIWRFYLGEAFATAENAAEMAGHCSAAGLALVLKYSAAPLPDGAETLELVRAYPDLSSILVAAHYEEAPNRLYFGSAYLPEPPGSIEVYEMRSCALAGADP